jgi:uncharacterized membrane protein
MKALARCVFAAMLLFAAIFIIESSADLPLTVASHFDAAGQPNSYMSHDGYVRFALCLALGLPILVVAILSAVYSRAADFKLPNKEYWLAPQRLARTRAFLVTHGLWFGSLLVILVCAIHWLVLGANRRQPPQLSNQSFGVCLVAFLIATAAWIAVLMFAFRRPETRPSETRPT